ncbi:MAG: GAF domain-containing protein [Anaerolineae bacterium]|nr:GAF domain-containing protein [Anaerolineae bacterium]
MASRLFFLLSPPAIGFLPIFIVQLSILAYLFALKNKSTPTWLFTGWIACMALVSVSKLLGHSFYDPCGGYVNWFGGMGGSLAGLIFLLQFTYHFPRSRFPREARAVLIASLVVTFGILALVVYEALTPPIFHLYDFEQFVYGIVHSRYDRALVSVNIFGFLHPAGYFWALLVCLRQVGHNAQPGLGHFLRALWRPLGTEAQSARAFTIAIVGALLPVIASTLESKRLSPLGSLTVTYLLAMFVLVVTYLNHSPEPASFLVKLVGIVLVILLSVVGVSNLVILDLHRQASFQTQRAEVAYIQALVKTGGPESASLQADAVPFADVLYIATRPADGGLFPSAYHLIFSRRSNLDVQTFVEQEAFFKRELARPVVQLAVSHENPWLDPEQIQPATLARIVVAEGGPSYRGGDAEPAQHVIRYTFRLEDTLYEVGYGYFAYRQMLHQKAIPLVYVTIGITLLVWFVFPVFYRSTLVAPLGDLLRGVTRLNNGDLDVTVPVRVADEIGFLARSFNGMVASLRTLTADLRQEIVERRRAEAEVQALNVTLEQRVTERTHDLMALYQVSAVTSQDLALPALLAELLSRTTAAVSGSGGGVYLLEGGALQLAAHKGIPAAMLSSLASFSPDNSLLRWVIEQREPLLIPDMSADARAPEALRRAGGLTLILLPLQAGGQIMGILGLVRPAGQTFNLEAIALLSSIADQMGQAVESDRLHHLARQASVLEERQRIARDLHDSVTQSLYGLATLTEAGQAQLESDAGDAVGRTLAHIGETTRQALREMRLFIHQLRPPELESEGLVGALHQRLAAVEGRSNIRARLLVDEAVPASLPAAAQEAFYRIANEALNNALRHARATEVTLYLRHADGRSNLEIVDDGCGFDPQTQSKGGMGLRNMREYAAQVGGALRITSAPGAGTRVEVTL